MEGSALCASRALIQKSGEICPLPRAHSAEMEAKMGGKAEEGELTNEADRPLIRRVMGQMKKMNSQAEGMRRHGSGDMTTSAVPESVACLSTASTFSALLDWMLQNSTSEW